MPWVPLVSIKSPTRKASSIRKKIPAIISFTRVWAPKPMARPTTPAPAISGPMLTPKEDRTISETKINRTARTNLRSRTSKVPMREPPAPPSSISSSASGISSLSLRSMRALMTCQAINPRATVIKILRTECVKRRTKGRSMPHMRSMMKNRKAIKTMRRNRRIKGI